MRLFIAVFPPREVRDAIVAAAETLREGSSGVAWVKPDNLHFTLRFFGETDEPGAARAELAMQAAASTTQAFRAACGGFGAFPTPRRARVLWLGMGEGAGALAGLAKALVTELEQEGFPPADRAFTPHLTLGRVRLREQDWTRLPSLAAVGPEFLVDRLTLVESVLSPGGSRYTTRAQVLLAPPPATL